MSVSLVLGVIGGSYIPSSKIEYRQVDVLIEPLTQEQIIERAAKNIYESNEFQKEMSATAMARALYKLSIEQQDNAVKLSERAVEQNSNSQLLADAWMFKNSSTTKH